MACLEPHSEVVGAERAQACVTALTGVKVKGGGLGFGGLAIGEFKMEELEFKTWEEQKTSSPNGQLSKPTKEPQGREAAWVLTQSCPGHACAAASQPRSGRLCNGCFSQTPAL